MASTINLKSITKSPITLTVAVLTLFLVNLIGGFTGVPNWDSNELYAQAVSRHYTDWHPPIMAWLWSGLRLIADGSAPIFFLHVFFYWFGFGLIAFVLHNMHFRKTAWGIVATGVFPPFVMMNVNVLKDVGVAVSFLASFSIIFWYRARDKKVPFAALTIPTILLFYGIMVRANGIFGGAPLIIYMLSPRLLGRPIRFLMVCLAIVLFTIPASAFFNHKIIGAESAHPHRSLEIFDVAGIAYFSGDMSVFEQGNFAKDFIAKCYFPLLWDTLAQRGECKVIWQTGYPHQTKMWLGAIFIILLRMPNIVLPILIRSLVLWLPAITPM